VSFLLKNALKRYTQLPYLISYLETGKLSLLDTATWPDANDCHFTAQYAKAKGAEKTYALCFTMARETFHHWDIFAHGVSGVCIEFDREKLLANLSSIKEIICGAVTYHNIRSLNNKDLKHDKLPFIKRTGYADEREYRLIAATKKMESGKYDIAIPPETIRCITTAPRLSYEAHQHVKVSLRRINGANKLKISKSSLISNEKWKQIGTDIGAT